MKDFSVVCCSVVRDEVTRVLTESYPGAEAVFLDSVLHMKPGLLQKTVDDAVAGLSGPVVVVYGDCGPGMEELVARPRCARVDCVNCAQLLLGLEHYRWVRQEKAFLFLPEWTLRWKEVFQQELGFRDPSLARLFLKENHRSLIYLDTGQVPVPHTTIREIADFFALPMTILPITLDALRTELAACILRMRSGP